MMRKGNNINEYDRLIYKLNLSIEFIASFYIIGLKCHHLTYKVCFARFSNRVTIALKLLCCIEYLINSGCD